MSRDLYKILGVAKNASDAEIKKAYRSLAMKYHPDRNPGDDAAGEKFKEIQAAYAILSKPDKRAAYDQFGEAGVAGQAGGAGQGGFDFSEIFENFFGDLGDVFGGGGRSHQRRGADLRYPLEIDLQQAVHGCEIKIQIPSLVNCKTCHGSGAKKGSSPVNCETCEGEGQVRMQQGFFSIQQTCPSCRGQGRVITDPCRDCRGQGRVQEQRSLSVKIPAGVDNGDRIRLSGEGEAGEHGATAGDLYIEIHVKPHEIFQRQENNLLCEIPIAFVDAALGGEVKVPTIDGQVNLKIPAGTQSGKVFRLRGKGVTSVRGRGTGDLLCTVVVETPIKLTAEQKQYLQQFADAIGDGNKNSPRQQSWFAGVKKFFEDIKFS